MAALTFATGLVEAAALLGLGPVFTAMQTGNVLFLGFGLLGQGGLSVSAPAVSLGAFVLGAVTGARLEGRLEAHRHRWFVLAVTAEGLLVAAAGGVAWGVPPLSSAPTGRHLGVIATLAFAMGLRNVTAMRVAVPDMPTTLVTRAMTAFLAGSLLGRDPAFGRGPGATQRRAASVGAMFAGGVVGAAFIRWDWPLSALLWSAGGISLLVAAAFVPQARLRSG
ncbi:YoaK family protein [Streptomyces sp. NPDC093225]|uniref:YoaK family protein n=1 Tax=Streptomyces sp. NPDC093225 TaxID=3366034 RepID=UPI003806AA40